MYYKQIENGYINSLHISEAYQGEEITEEEYNIIMSVINSKPEDTETHFYKLKADTLEYEAIERLEPSYNLEESTKSEVID